MKPAVFLVFLLFFSVSSCNKSTRNLNKQEPPIVDGFNSEFNLLEASKYPISESVMIQIYQNDHFVWISYNVPEGSYGIMDMILEAPNLNNPINLHVSAQVGEWPANQPELAPKVPESEKWGITKGWTGNALWFKKMDSTGTEPELVFKSAPARELQLSKTHFGKGNWKFSIEIRAIKGTDGAFENLKFPNNSEKFDLEVY